MPRSLGEDIDKNDVKLTASQLDTYEVPTDFFAFIEALDYALSNHIVVEEL